MHVLQFHVHCHGLYRAEQFPTVWVVALDLVVPVFGHSVLLQMSFHLEPFATSRFQAHCVPELRSSVHLSNVIVSLASITEL